MIRRKRFYQALKEKIRFLDYASCAYPLLSEKPRSFPPWTFCRIRYKTPKVLRIRLPVYQSSCLQLRAQGTITRLTLIERKVIGCDCYAVGVPAIYDAGFAENPSDTDRHEHGPAVTVCCVSDLWFYYR